MVAIEKILLAALGMTAIHAAGISSPCPNNQSLISNNKCCPGYSLVESDGTSCCVQDLNWQCDDATLCFNGKNCKAKVSVDDPDYDQKVNDALGTAPSSTSTSSPATTSTSTSASGSAASSDSASGSSTATDSTATSSGTAAAAATGNAAAGARDATFGVVAALAAVPVVFYAL
ncbi:hypothetical protein Hte_002312 [Hypoxylon texense]